MSSKKVFWWLPVVVILTLIIGFILGNYFSSKTLGRKLFFSTGNKVDVILDIINQEYVDTVDMRDLVENAIPKLISELDPHSTYIPAEDLEAVNEDMEGHFSGIGVQFTLQKDTIMVVSVISGGPSEKVGIQPGDRIISIGDSLFAGPDVTNDKIMKTLRGEKGSIVKIGVKRNSSDKIQYYEITRGDIPVNTVDIAYEVSKNIGLIKINKFGRTTYNEFVMAMAKLMDSGCNSFIIDLRMNTGGFLDAAINIINEFLPQGRLIVYTHGKAFPRNDAVANGTGTCQENQVIILMDEVSASASEIVAGAIQDNDRGLIIGRRSYGKGLVQNQIGLSDGSALRLTIARYYTPSGRSIQRSYEMGKTDDYEQAWIDRFSHGESYSQDSIKFDESLKYTTITGRTVYGGGGIMPDIFIPRDTTGITSYYTNLIRNGILYEYAFRYTDQNRELLGKFKDYKSLWNYLKTQPILYEVIEYAETKDIKRRPVLINISRRLIENMTYAYILRNQFGDDGFYPVLLYDDPVVLKAIDVINKGQALPDAISQHKYEK